MKSNFTAPFIIFLLLSFFSHRAFSEISQNDSDSRFLKWAAGAALTFGGDEIGQVEVFNIFDNAETESIDAGEFLYIYGGISVPFWQEGRVEHDIQLTIGYHTDSISGGGDSVGFDRFPLDLMYSLTVDVIRVGAGVTRHYSPTLDLKDAGGGSFDFDDANGEFLEISYEFSGDQFVYLRGTWIDYEIMEQTFSGDNIGIGFLARI